MAILHLILRPVFIFILLILFGITQILPLGLSHTDISLRHIYQNLAYTFSNPNPELIEEKYLATSLVQDGEYVYDEKSVWDNQPVSSLDHDIAAIVEEKLESAVLSAHLTPSGEEKWIEIDLSDQKLYAHEGNSTVYDFKISSGRPWTPTLEGEFRVWVKMRYTRMQGGSRKRGDYYDLKNVPYVMYYDRGYGIHGAYWHNSFGQPRSHGCVNLKVADAEKLFYWASPVLASGSGVVYPSADNTGVRIVIHK